MTIIDTRNRSPGRGSGLHPSSIIDTRDRGTGPLHSPSSYSPIPPAPPMFGYATPARTLNETARTMSEQQLTVAGAGDVLPIIYGRAAVGPKVCAAVDNNGSLILLLAWALGECDAIESVTADDAALPATITLTHYLGTQTQTADPTLIAAFLNKGRTYADALPGVCYSVASIAPGSSTGFPRFVAFIRGLKVRQTSGGARSWSDNAAYCVADFIESADYGMGKAVNWTDVAAVAAACDATVGGERKRILNVALMDSQPCETWLAVLRDYAGCWAFPEGGVYRLIPDAPAASVMTFTTANMLAGSLKLGWRQAANNPTAIEVSYTDTTTKPYRDNSVTKYAPGVLAGTVERRLSQISKPGIWRLSEANRYAIERLNASLMSGLGISFTAFDEALALQIGNVVTVTHPVGLAGDLFRVTALDPAQPGRWLVSALKYDPAAYSSEVVTGPPAPPGGVVDPSNPPAVAGLAVLEDVYQVATGLFGSRLVVTWNAATFPFVDSYVVKITQAGVLKDEGSVSLDPAPRYVSKQLSENLTYVVTVQIRSTIGALGTAASFSIINNGKAGIPKDIGWLTAFEIGGEVRLNWSPTAADGTALDLDWTATEIRYGAVGGSWATATLIDRVGAPGVRYATRIVPAGTWVFYAKALDSVRTTSPPAPPPGYPFGQESANAASATATVTSDANAFVAIDYAYTTPTLYKMAAGTGYWITDSTGTFNATFTSNVNSYGNPINTYGAAASSALLTEIKDHGTTVTGDWLAAIGVTNVAGTAGVFLDLNNPGAEGAKTITGATNATPIVIASTGHGYTSGDEVEQTGVLGNTAANGRFLITVSDADHYSLQDFAGYNVAGNGTWSAGGTQQAKRWVWASYASLSAKTAARYSRLRVRTAGVAKVTSLGSIRVNVVSRHEAGMLTTSASAGAIVTLAGAYTKAVGAQATPVFDDGTTPDGSRCVVDMIETSAARGLGVGYVLKFVNANSQYVTVGDFSKHDFGSGSDLPFSIEVWAYPVSYPINAGLVAKDGVSPANSGQYRTTVNANGIPTFQIIDETNTASWTITGSTAVVLNRWTHLAFTYNGSGNPSTGAKIYVDGVLEPTTALQFGSYVAMRNTAKVLQFGSRGTGSGFWNGNLDDVRIWDTERSVAQILANKDILLTGSESGLVGYWKFDEGSGTSAIDSTANAKHGTLSGTTGVPIYRPYNGFNLYRFDNSGTPVAKTAAWQFDGV